MSRQRFVDPRIWKSEQFGKLPTDNARLLWIGILTTADDEGRRKATPESLKADIFPLKKVRLTTLADERDAIADLGLIRIYADGEGNPVLDIPKWGLYQNPKYRKPSRFPTFGDKVDRTRDNSDRIGTLGSGCGSGCDSGSGKEAAAADNSQTPSEKGSKTLPAKRPRVVRNPAPPPSDYPKELEKFPLFRQTARSCKVFPALIASWKKRFPSLNIGMELDKAHTHAESKDAQGKPYKNFVKFMTGWIIRTAGYQEKEQKVADSATLRNERIFAAQAAQAAQAAKDAQDKKGGR